MIGDTENVGLVRKPVGEFIIGSVIQCMIMDIIRMIQFPSIPGKALVFGNRLQRV